MSRLPLVEAKKYRQKSTYIQQWSITITFQIPALQASSAVITLSHTQTISGCICVLDCLDIQGSSYLPHFRRSSSSSITFPR